MAARSGTRPTTERRCTSWGWPIRARARIIPGRSIRKSRRPGGGRSFAQGSKATWITGTPNHVWCIRPQKQPQLYASCGLPPTISMPGPRSVRRAVASRECTGWRREVAEQKATGAKKKVGIDGKYQETVNVMKQRTVERLLLPARDAAAMLSISERTLWVNTVPRGDLQRVWLGNRRILFVDAERAGRSILARCLSGRPKTFELE